MILVNWDCDILLQDWLIEIAMSQHRHTIYTWPGGKYQENMQQIWYKNLFQR